ncbi:MAG: ATP-binding protein [Planctomycetota bacterium]|nr:ATP-binding protein [Planctomycetota bacterium]
MLFEEIVLTPEEDLVIQALNIIEPGIERIATSGGERWRMGSSRSGSRGGLLLKCKDVGDRIPIGSLGDGIWRLLGLALALVRSADGVVLIDEIDTGLHYSVMEKMWSLVAETARRLNIQVFATTHSRDCYESLGVACRSVDSQRGEITIQRLEKGKQRSTVYYEPEIRAIRESRLEQNRFEVR